MNFTDRGIMALKTTKETEIFRSSSDTGFAIEVSKAGKKKFVFIYMFRGKKRKMPLGMYPGLTLVDARQRWRDARNLFENGIDPQEVPVEPEPSPAPEVQSFKDLSTDYLEKYSAVHHSDRWHYNIKKAVDADILPVLGSKSITEIRRPDIISLIETVAARAPGQSRTVLKCIRQIFDYAILREMVDSNPCSMVPKAVPSVKQVSRDRVLSDDEIRHNWTEIEAGPGSLEVKCALKLILITAQRPEEVVELKKEDLDLADPANSWWNMPQSKQETNGDGERPIHRVFLTPLALEYIPTVDKGHVFKSPEATDDKDIPMKRNSVSQLVLRKIFHKNKEGKKELKKLPYYGLSRWTPHDLRRTARTIMSRIGIIREHAEQVIGHKIGGVEGVYNRYQYDNEKKAALLAWEKELMRIVGITPPVAAEGAEEVPAA